MAIPLLVVGGIAAAAAIGGAAAAAKAKAGKSGYRANTFGESKHYDPNRFEYGGRAGYAEESANRYQAQAGIAQSRQAAQADYGHANDWERAANRSRGDQSLAAQLMMQRAQGLVPSIADMQARQDMQRAFAAQTAQQASARGAAGLALAQQSAANNTANLQAGISNQSQINAANERLAAEQSAYGAYSGLRQADFASQQQAAQQAQFNAQMTAQQRALNDQYAMGLLDKEQAVRQMQMQGNMNQQGLLSGSHMGMQQINSGISMNNANRDMEYFKMAVGGVSGAAGIAAQGGGGAGGAAPRADGGPVEAGKTYLVGERGPELIVPAESGLVIPNEALARGNRFDEDYRHRTAQASMDLALALKEQERRDLDKTFARDTAAQQQAVKEAYLAQASREADAQIAAYQSALGKGASVALNEGEIDAGAPPGWLDAYMARQQQAPMGLVVEQAPARYTAMRAYQ